MLHILQEARCLMPCMPALPQPELSKKGCKGEPIFQGSSGPTLWNGSCIRSHPGSAVPGHAAPGRRRCATWPRRRARYRLPAAQQPPRPLGRRWGPTARHAHAPPMQSCTSIQAWQQARLSEVCRAVRHASCSVQRSEPLSMSRRRSQGSTHARWHASWKASVLCVQ